MFIILFRTPEEEEGLPAEFSADLYIGEDDTYIGEDDGYIGGEE